MRNAMTLVTRTLAFVLVWMAIWAPCLLVAKPLLNVVALETYSDVTGAVAVLAASLIMARLAARGGLQEVGYSLAGLGRHACLGLILGLGMSGAVLLALWIAGQVRVAEGVGVTSLPIAGLTGVSLVFNSLLQEGLVRGFILAEARALIGPRLALAWSSLLFMAMHGGVYRWSPEAGFMAANLLLAGCALGLSVLWTGSLWLAVAAHFAWNMSESLIYGQSTGAALFAGFQGRWITLNTPSLETGPVGLVGPLVGVAVMSACLRLRPRQGGRV